MSITNKSAHFRPSSKATRFVYAVALLLVALPPVMSVRYAWVLFKQMPSNPNIVNPITATFTIVVAAAVVLAVGYRIRGLFVGAFRLECLATSGVPHVMRLFGLFLMCAGVLVVLVSFVARVATGIAAVAMIAGQFYSLVAVGLVFFEFSRVLERELLLERHEI